MRKIDNESDGPPLELNEDLRHIAMEGSDMTRDIHVALRKDLRNRPFSHSMPESEMLLYQDIGKASDIAQPGGFRRAHVRNRHDEDGCDHLDFTPLMEKIHVKKPADFLESIYDNFVYAQFEAGLSREDFEGESISTPLIRRVHRRESEAARSEAGKLEAEEKGASLRKTVFTILKSFIGSGVLFLPKGFDNGGMLFSTMILCISAALSTFCMLRLTDCAIAVKSKNGISYGMLGEIAYGKWGKAAVDISLVLSQLGFCCSYLIFNARNVRDVIMHISNCALIPSMELLIVLQLPLVTPLTWVRKIKYFAITNLVADLFILLGLSYIMGYSIEHMVMTKDPPTWRNFNGENWGLFLGTAVYVFEGIGLVLPIYDSMDSSIRHKFPSVLTTTIGCLVVFFCLFSGLVYASFGKDTQAVVTLNLPNNGVQYGTIGVQLAYCIALLFTYPLMIYPAVAILEGYIMRASSIKGALRWKKNTFRLLLVCVTMVVSCGGSEQLDNFVALIGGFCSVPLAFIYPCLFHSRIVKGGTALNNVITVVGICTMIFATFQAISTWSSAKNGDYCSKP